MKKRKIIQIFAIPCGSAEMESNSTIVFALCNDGTVWAIGRKDNWSKLPDIPQGDHIEEILNDV
jgi:hypothetical protein